MTFEKTWAGLAASLTAGDVLSGWSAAKGKTELRFKIADIGENWISIVPSTGRSRRISRSDFDQVYAFWLDYKKGK